MKGKRKCENLNNKPPNYENLCGNDNWNRNFGNVSKRQQSARRFYNNSEPYDGMCGGHGRFVLDFESSSVHSPSVEEDSGDCGIFFGGSTFGSSNVPRFLPDDRYDCLFRQSGRESSAASARRNMSNSTDLPGLVGFSPTDQHSLFLSGYRGGPAIFDFKTSTVLMSSMNGGNQTTNLSNNSPCTFKECFPPPLTKQQKKGDLPSCEFCLTISPVLLKKALFHYHLQTAEEGFASQRE
ncbi:hypothetical protein Tco_0018062 [Tanacetum coccineum]